MQLKQLALSLLAVISPVWFDVTVQGVTVHKPQRSRPVSQRVGQRKSLIGNKKSLNAKRVQNPGKKNIVKKPGAPQSSKFSPAVIDDSESPDGEDFDVGDHKYDGYYDHYYGYGDYYDDYYYDDYYYDGYYYDYYYYYEPCTYYEYDAEGNMIYDENGYAQCLENQCTEFERNLDGTLVMDENGEPIWYDI